MGVCQQSMQLLAFSYIQWECELNSGRPTTRCYFFNLAGHHDSFWGKNHQVLLFLDITYDKLSIHHSKFSYLLLSSVSKHQFNRVQRIISFAHIHSSLRLTDSDVKDETRARTIAFSNPCLSCLYISVAIMHWQGRASLIQCYIGGNNHSSIPYTFEDDQHLGDASSDTQWNEGNGTVESIMIMMLC
jgi:hypothetical protein